MVTASTARDSRNYRIILELLDNGAELQKTEDPVLLLRERENILGIMGQETTPDEQRDAQQYRSQRDQLMEARDKFIAETINETLKTGEIGVLFIGAQHDPIPHLAEDVSVEAVKSPAKAIAYFEELFSDQDGERFEELRQYLVSPVDA